MNKIIVIIITFIIGINIYILSINDSSNIKTEKNKRKTYTNNQINNSYQNKIIKNNIIYTEKIKNDNSSNSTSKNNIQNLHINFVNYKIKKEITQKIKNGDLTPVYNTWKPIKKGVNYNIFITNNPETTSRQNNFTPPIMPNISTIKINNKKISIIIPKNSEAYIAIKTNSNNIEYKNLNNNQLLLTPPEIGK